VQGFVSIVTPLVSFLGQLT